MNSERLLERFLRYARIDTTAVPDAGRYPSSAGQIELGKLLLGELQQIGLRDIQQSQFGIVTATLPANVKHRPPTLAFNAHLDTSPETSGANVRPQVWRQYDGRDLTLPSGERPVLRVRENPELADLLGKTIVTSDGSTLLGGDDKAGIAVIVEAVAYLAEHAELPRGELRVLFTCDEEIGHGVDHVDLAQLNADVCYTLDGAGADTIDVECFSAEVAHVTLRGVNIHPAIAKGRMVNALRAAAEFIARMPFDKQSPESTEGRQGFLHPYDIAGGVGEVRLKVLLRDFDRSALASQAQTLLFIGKQVEDTFPGVSVSVETFPQYFNLGEGLAKEPRAVGLAEEALGRLGRTPKRTIIRGGTDGAHFTHLGLPTPNLATGQHNPHSVLEWVCLEEMEQAARVIVELAQLWAREGR